MWAFYQDHAEVSPDYPARINPMFLTPMAVGTQTTTTSIARAGGLTYLIRHPLESSEDFINRMNRCAVVDVCGPALDLLCGAVGQPDNTNCEIPDAYTEFWEDCDLQDSDFLTFMSSVRRNAATFGLSYLFVDSSKAVAPVVTQRDVQEQGIRPFVREICPLDLLNWRLDAQGKVIECLFRIHRDVPGTLLDTPTGEQVYEYRYWNQSIWIAMMEDKGDVTIIDQGPNPLGEIPLVPVYHRRKRALQGESLLKQSGKYGQLLTNMLSNLDATLVQQSFSQACLTSSETPSKVGVGANVVLHLHPEHTEGDTKTGAEKYEFVSPDPAPIAMLLQAFSTILDLANESMSLRPEGTVSKGSPESGISRAWRWHSAEQRLKTMSNNEQTAVRNVMDLVALWMGDKEFPGSIAYGQTFDLTSLEDSVSNMVLLQSAGLPPTARMELMRNAISKSLPNLPTDIQDTISKELEAMAKAPEPVAPAVPGAPPAGSAPVAPADPTIKAPKPGDQPVIGA